MSPEFCRGIAMLASEDLVARGLAAGPPNSAKPTEHGGVALQHVCLQAHKGVPHSRQPHGELWLRPSRRQSMVG